MSFSGENGSGWHERVVSGTIASLGQMPQMYLPITAAKSMAELALEGEARWIDHASAPTDAQIDRVGAAMTARHGDYDIDRVYEPDIEKTELGDNTVNPWDIRRHVHWVGAYAIGLSHNIATGRFDGFLRYVGIPNQTTTEAAERLDDIFEIGQPTAGRLTSFLTLAHGALQSEDFRRKAKAYRESMRGGTKPKRQLHTTALAAIENDAGDTFDDYISRLNRAVANY